MYNLELCSVRGRPLSRLSISWVLLLIFFVVSSVWFFCFVLFESWCFFAVFVPVNNDKYQNIMIVIPSETPLGTINLKCNQILEESLFPSNFWKSEDLHSPDKPHRHLKFLAACVKNECKLQSFFKNLLSQEVQMVWWLGRFLKKMC